MKYSIWLLLLIIAACKPDQTSPVDSKLPLAEVTGGELMADTIIYDVIIKNINPEDNWAETSLQYLQHDKLVDSLLNLVYHGEASAYDYFNNTRITPDELKQMEEDNTFSREGIGKIQFTERWFLDNRNSTLHKEVLSLVLGDENYTETGEFRGYKPICKIVLKP
jgi:hypothetical protein